MFFCDERDIFFRLPCLVSSSSIKSLIDPEDGLNTFFRNSGILYQYIRPNNKENLNFYPIRFDEFKISHLNIWCKLWNSVLCNFLHVLIISSIFCLNILFGILFMNTLTVCRNSFSVSDQFSNTCNWADN